MTEKKASATNIWIRRLGKWLSVIILVLVITGITGRLLLKTQPVLNLIKDTVVQQANAQLNATLSIKKLSGDAATRLIWHGITLAQQVDTVASIDSLMMDYSLWTLWHGKLDMQELSIHRPNITARQSADGTWNLETLVTVSDTTEQKISRTEASSLPFGLAIHHIRLLDGKISLNSPMLPDSAAQINQINATGGFSIFDDSFQADLNELEGTITGMSTGQTTIKASANASESIYTLEKLLVTTGFSLFQLDGSYQTPQSRIRSNVLANPLSWRDLDDIYSGPDFHLKSDLRANISLRGDWPELNIKLQASADGLDSLQWDTQFRVDSLINIKQTSLNVKSIDANALLDTTGYPVIENLVANFEGHIHRKKPALSKIKGRWKVQNIHYHDKATSLKTLRGEADLENRAFNLTTSVDRAREHWKATFSAPDVTDEQLSWTAVITGEQVNPGFWAANERVTGSLNLAVYIDGTGFEPNQELPWNYTLKANHIEIGEQKAKMFTTAGRLTNHMLSLDGQLQISQSSIAYTGRYQWDSSIPDYQLTVTTDAFNLAEFQGLANFPTSITGGIDITGTGIKPETMKADAVINLDTSYVNGALLSDLSATIELADSVLYLNEGTLKSEIAEGALSARLHTFRYYDPQNRLDLEGEINSISSLAPLLQVSNLDGQGNLFGTLKPDRSGSLHYSGELSLHNLQIGEKGTLDSLRINANASVSEVISYGVTMRIKRPAYSEITLNDARFSANGTYAAEGQTDGQFGLNFRSLGTQSVQHSGNYFYSLAEDSLTLQTSELSVQGGREELTLANPFQIIVADGTIKMDSFQLTSPGGSSLKLALPIFGANELSLNASAEQLNLADVQMALLDDIFIKGQANIDLSIEQREDSLDVRFENQINAFSIPEILTLDTLTSSINIKNSQFRAEFLGVRGTNKWVDGFLDIPFQLGDPNQFDEAFFEQPVSGSITMAKTPLRNFQGLLRRLGLVETTGNIGFLAELDGTAGQPAMNAHLNITPMVTSGVKLDSILTDFSYNHSEQKLNINSEVNSLSQNLAVLKGRFPLHIDLKNATINPPQPQDSITGSIETNDFNMAALNELADPKLLRNISGNLNGGVTIRGTSSSPKIMGSMQLKKGAFQMVPAGMTYQAINSQVVFKGDEIQLARFSMRGDKGSLSASGSIQLDDLMPESMDISVKAKTFKLANTRELSLNISTNSKIGGSLTKPQISGSLTINNGFYYLQNFGEKSVEEVKLDSEFGDQSKMTDSLQVDAYDNLSLDINVNITNAFSIRNRRFLDMQIDLTGEMDMVKKANKSLEVFGVLEAEDGYARPLGKNFKLDEGTITFDGNPENPFLNITTKYRPPQPADITIFYKITGRADKPKFVYESIPEMDKKNILSYTLFGQPFYGIDSWKQVVASPEGSNSAVTDLALNVMLDRVENLATQRLGIDVVQIDNTQTNSRSSTTLKTGWYLNEKTFFAVLNELSGSSPDTQFLLEYFLRNNLKLILTQGQSNRTGIDVSWQYDY